MSNLLQLTLFGSPEIRRHGQMVTGFRSSKAQALLYYLAVTGRPHTRPTLAGLFWGDQPEAAARTSLSKCLSNLRELVGDALLVERQTVAFNHDYPYGLDTEHFLAGVGQPPTPETIPSLQTALALYRGDFLEGFYVREAPDFEQWVLVQRAHYREAVMQGLHTLATYADQQGDLPQAITHTRRLLTLEPWREEAHRQLMTRLARSGQHTAALAQFETCRRLLDEELAVEPDAETVALMEAIRGEQLTDKKTGKPEDKEIATTALALSSHLSVSPSLPMPPTPLIGRERELAELAALINDPQCRLITITGPGGMGKTRLALAVAAAQGGKFQHGAVFVSLAGVSSSQFLPQAILSALNIPLQGTLSPQEQVRATLYNQERLLVLDTYEHLLPDVELLIDMLYSAPQITLLVTSRERLALQAEYLSELAGLAYPAQLPQRPKSESAADLINYAAIQLFLQRVRQTQPRFTPSDAEVAAMVHICGELDGIPLAIELAAARARILPVEQIAARLNDRLKLLTTGNRTAPPRHQTLRAAIDWSYDLLADDERLLLRRLSVFAGSFPLEAVEHVCGPLPTPLLDLMSQLVDKSLVLVNRDGDEMHYRLLDTIGEYAHEKLLIAGEGNHLRINHLDFFIQLAETALPKLLGAEQGRWLARLERAHDNLRVALSWTIEQRLCIEALRMTGALGYFWDVHGHWREGQQWLEQALHLRHGADANLISTAIAQSWRARALWQAGNFRWRYRDFVGARTLLQESLAIYRSLDDKAGIGHVLSHLGWIHLELGETVQAQTIFNDCLAVRLEVGNKQALGSAFFNIGIMALVQGDSTNGQIALTESLKFFREAGDQRGATHPLLILGEIANLQGKYKEAQTLYAESLTLGRELGEKRTVADALASVANVRVKLNDVEKAQTLYLESLSLYNELGDQRGVATALSGLARIRQAQGQPKLAAQMFGASDALITAIQGRIGEPEISDQQRAVALLHTQLDNASFNAAWEKGRILSLEPAFALAHQST